MTSSCDLASVDPVAERIWRNAQVLSSLRNSEVNRQFFHFGTPHLGDLRFKQEIYALQTLPKFVMFANDLTANEGEKKCSSLSPVYHPAAVLDFFDPLQIASVEVRGPGDVIGLTFCPRKSTRESTEAPGMQALSRGEPMKKKLKLATFQIGAPARRGEGL